MEICELFNDKYAGGEAIIVSSGYPTYKNHFSVTTTDSCPLKLQIISNKTDIIILRSHQWNLISHSV